MKLSILLLTVVFFMTAVPAQTLQADATSETITNPAASTEYKKTKLNFFVTTKRKKGKLDLATRFSVLRAKLRSCFHRKHLITIIAKDMANLNKKIDYWVNKEDAVIGTLWFDSHGSYKKGYSVFHIGSDEISYKTITDECIRSGFEKLSPYTNGDTRVIIGSCYGGATYARISVDYKDSSRMKGDSLMISMGKIFRNGIVYGSESWVMTKPGLFRRQPAVAGSPGHRLYRDICYEPAWKNVGVWNQYDVHLNSFEKSNPVALDKNGNLVIRSLPYLEEKHKTIKIVEKKLTTLQPGMYK